MSWTIPHLLRNGHEVRGVDSFVRYGRSDRPREYEFVEGDLVDRDFARRVVQGCDCVIQAAARIYGVVGFHQHPADILSHDVTLHQNLLWAARDLGVQRFVYISSSMVYERCTRVPSHEDEVDDMPIPYTDYGLSKLMGERLCRAFGEQYGLSWTVWRPFNLITPYEAAEAEIGVSHVFADFLQRIVVERANPMPILGDGEQVRCFTWVDDVAETIARHLASPESDRQAFNLGNPRPVTMRELALMAYAEAGRQGLVDATKPLEFQHLPVFRDDVRLRVPAIDKARRVLGFEPRVSLEMALERCVAEAAARAGVAR